MILFHRIYFFLYHWLFEINEHSLHSPFLFDFYIRVIRKAKSGYPDIKIETLREKLKKSKTEIRVRRSDNMNRSLTYANLGSISKSGITRPEYSVLFREIISYFRFKNIVELGTSIGINTLYLANNSSVKTVTTFEKNPELIRIAKNNFSEFPDLNINLVEGDIEEKLPDFLKQVNRIDMAYFDANHTFDATLTYYSWLFKYISDTGVLIFDDIYWSPEMTKAWRHICRKSSGTLILDLYQVGIIIKKKDIPSGYFKIAF